MANSWSGLRRQLENELLCEKLRGRVQYFLTHYHSAPDENGRMAIRVDGAERLLGNPYSYAVKGYCEAEDRIKRENHVPWREWTPKGVLYECENRAVENAVKSAAMDHGVFEIYDLTDAIQIYRQSPIDCSLHHENPLVRLFAVLDRRVGKRALIKLAGTVADQPVWLQYFYRLRLEAENLPVPSGER